MSKAPMHSVYCINCDWELNNTHKHTDGWKCPKCNDSVIQIFKRKEHNNGICRNKNQYKRSGK